MEPARRCYPLLVGHVDGLGVVDDHVAGEARTCCRSRWTEAGRRTAGPARRCLFGQKVPTDDGPVLREKGNIFAGGVGSMEVPFYSPPGPWRGYIKRCLNPNFVELRTREVRRMIQGANMGCEICAPWVAAFPISNTRKRSLGDRKLGSDIT